MMGRRPSHDPHDEGWSSESSIVEESFEAGQGKFPFWSNPCVVKDPQPDIKYVREVKKEAHKQSDKSTVI
jgi:hypothetical protein